MVKTPEAIERLTAPDAAADDRQPDEADGQPAEAGDERATEVFDSVAARREPCDGVSDEELYTVVEMLGKQVRVSKEDATHWARFHDAPDHEWYRWRIDWTVPGGRLVRR